MPHGHLTHLKARLLIILSNQYINNPSSEDLWNKPALELASLISRREISSVEVVSTFIQRINKYNPLLNAFLTVGYENALKAAEKADNKVMNGDEIGPLHGLPISVKDLERTKGIRTTFGSLIFANHVPESDSGVVEKIKAAGCIIIGKSNTPEFGVYGTETSNRLGEPCHNPWDTSRTTGGSSGGAAVSVVTRMSPLGTATDGGGSIRIPASYCGVFGIKPSQGTVTRYSGLPDQYIQPILSQPGPVANSVADAALLLQIMSGYDHRDSSTKNSPTRDYIDALGKPVDKLRVAWSPDLGYAMSDPDVLDLTHNAAKIFDDVCAFVEEPGIKLDNPFPALGPIQSANTYTAYGHLYAEHKDRLMSGTIQRLEEGKKVTGTEYAYALHLVQILKYQVDRIFDDYDLLLTPSMPTSAFIQGMQPTKVGNNPMGPGGYNAFNPVFNLTGHPAASIPCGFTNKETPVGLQIVGRHGEESNIFKAATEFEKRMPWRHKLPPSCDTNGKLV